MHLAKSSAFAELFLGRMEEFPNYFSVFFCVFELECLFNVTKMWTSCYLDHIVYFLQKKLVMTSRAGVWRITVLVFSSVQLGQQRSSDKCFCIFSYVVLEIFSVWLSYFISFCFFSLISFYGCFVIEHENSAYVTFLCCSLGTLVWCCQ